MPYGERVCARRRRNGESKEQLDTRLLVLNAVRGDREDFDRLQGVVILNAIQGVEGVISGSCT